MREKADTELSIRGDKLCRDGRLKLIDGFPSGEPELLA
jgi:hypothetical protein